MWPARGDSRTKERKERSDKGVQGTRAVTEDSERADKGVQGTCVVTKQRTWKLALAVNRETVTQAVTVTKERA
jgi:hypothetical protein